MARPRARYDADREQRMRCALCGETGIGLVAEFGRAGWDWWSGYYRVGGRLILYPRTEICPNCVMSRGPERDRLFGRRNEPPRGVVAD